MPDDKKKLLLRVEEALDTVRPHLTNDGGDVSVVELTDDMTLRIKWEGNCSRCELSEVTLRAGIESAVRGRIPQIRDVKAVN